jgi:prepilin-type N-terminal cleavage/methylation domain-containing protein
MNSEEDFLLLNLKNVEIPFSTFTFVGAYLSISFYNMKPHKATRYTAGFSLIELLVIMMILGVLAGIALSSLSSSRQAARESVARKNAQQFASIALSAQIAGADPVAATVDATLTALDTGVTPTSGAFANRSFRIGGLADDDISRAAYYLEIANGQLAYLANKPNNPN